jgi:hypothetical protein
MTNRRWDTDERGIGAGNARDVTPQVERLLEAMRQDGWVAEEPEAHLLPHIRGATDRAPTLWRLESTDGSDPNRYVIDLEWRRRGGSLGDLVVDTYALIGRIAESHTHITERKTATTVEFDITTGILDGDGQWTAHGHVVTLRIAGPGVEALLRR